MGAVSYRGTLVDIAGDTWRIDIYDKNSSATSPEELTLAGEGFVINYSGDIRNKVNPIITSELTLSLAITSATDENLLTQLAGSVEGRFSLAIYLQSGPLYNLRWSGTILCDTIGYLDEYYPLRAELTASDDIGQLANILYEDNGTPYDSADYDSPITHLYQALKNLRQVDDFYSSTTGFIIYGNDFYSQDEPALANHLSTARIKYLTFNNPDENGVNDTLTCYDVIRNLCQVYNARLLQANGAFYFLPIGAYLDSQVNLNYEVILFNGSAGSSGLLSGASYVYEVGTGKEKKKGFRVEYYQPYKRVSRTQVYYGNLALLGADLYELVTNETLTDAGLDYPATELLKLTGSIQVAYQDSGSPSGSNRIGRSVIRITIKVGSYYLKRPITYSGTDSVILYGDTSASDYTPAQYGDTTWSATADTYDIISPIFDRAGYYDDPIHGFTIEVNKTLPELPANLTGLEFSAEIYDVSATGTETLVTDNTEYLYPAFIENLRMDWVENGVQNGDEVTFSALGQALNREELTQPVVLLGDVVSPNSRGVIQVYNGTSYQNSTGWKSFNTSTALPINRLGVEEVAALYNTTTKGILGDLYSGLLFPYQLIKDDSFYFLPTSLTFNAQSRVTKVEAFRVTRDVTGITSDQSDRRNINPPVIGFGPKPDTLDPVAPGGVDGVTSVNGVAPDGAGDVTIDAGDIEYTTGTSVAKAILDAETDVTSLQSSVIVGASDTDFVSGTTGINADKTNARVSLKIGGTEKARMSASLFTMDVDTDAPQLEATDYTKGLVLRDSTGQRYRITMNTSGNVVITAI